MHPLFRHLRAKFQFSVPVTMYKMVGEDIGVRLLVKNFYEVMENDPKAKECLHVHELINNRIPEEVKSKLYMFLSGWFGGPNLFVEAYGHPRMAARHLKVEISNIERDQWIHCMTIALKMHNPKLRRSHHKLMLNSFNALAMRIQNKH